MKNPLVLFVGAAVMAVVAVAGVTADRWQEWTIPFRSTEASPETVTDAPMRKTGEPDAKDPPPRIDTAEQVQPQQAPREPAAEPETDVSLQEPASEPETAEVPPGEPVAEAPVEAPVGESPVAEPERRAAVDPQEPEPAAASALEEPEPDAAVDPSFDVVRLEDDGSLIAAGRAAPGASVALLLGGDVIGRDAANQFGAWLIMPDAPLSPGRHELMVQASDGLGATTSGQAIALAVPRRAEDRPGATRSEPSTPQAPEEAAEVAEVAEPAPKEEPARLEPAEALPEDDDEEQVALAPVPPLPD
ncbi:MAG: hypothetical protein ACOC71_09235, partial [Hyphomicrobiales bacterium]